MRELVNALDFTYAALGRERVEQTSQLRVLTDQDDAGAFDAPRLIGNRQLVEPIPSQVIHESSVARSGDAV